MSMNSNLDTPSFNDGDVLAFRDGTLKFGKLKQSLDIAFRSKVPDALVDSLNTQKMHISSDRQFRVSDAWSGRDSNWFREGVDCELLQIRTGDWQKGKLRLRVTVEFVPEDEFEALEPTLNGAAYLEHHNGRANHLLNGSH